MPATGSSVITEASRDIGGIGGDFCRSLLFSLNIAKATKSPPPEGLNALSGEILEIVIDALPQTRECQQTAHSMFRRQ